MSSQAGVAQARTGQVSWPLLAGPIPPLADAYVPRPETGSGVVGGMAPGDTVALVPAGDAGGELPGELGGTGKTQLAAALVRAMASHDLRTPLTSIIGYVELIADGDAGQVSPAQAKMLDAMSRNARRLKKMIEDMLTISKIELGAFTSRLRPLDLAGLVQAASDVIRPTALTGGIAFEVSCPDHGLVVDGDAEQLDRVLVNLLSNAVKYTPKGGRVTMAMAVAGDWAVLTVADTGIGIPKADQASLFTRFFRASNAVAAEIQGSGLGLSIVRTIVTNHHGELRVESAQDQGTTVTVRIPLRRPEPAQPQRVADHGDRAGGHR